MDPEGGGVLRNLPRSRPGTRSHKREPGEAARTTSARPARPTEPAESPSDPVGGAVRVVAGAAGAGLRVADALTREVLRRLPRP
jgi:hypothetical protein